MSVGLIGPGLFRAEAPEPVGEPQTLISRLRERAGAKARVLLGFDFPIGVPKSYAAIASIDSFPTFLRRLGTEQASNFFRAADEPNEISVHRPFYPNVSRKGVLRADL